MAEIDLNTGELNKLFHTYVNNELAKSERNSTAFANDVYNLIDNSGQKYVMRILRAQHPETVEMEAAMQTKLALAGIRTPAYLELEAGSHVGKQSGIAFTLSKYIEGQVPKTASLELVADFGVTIAKLHNALDGLTIPPSKMQWFNLKNAKEDLDNYEGPLKKRLTNLVSKGEELFTLNLPEAVTHGDLWLGNVFADEDKVTAVFDLETAEKTIRVIDLARTYVSMRMMSEYSPKQLVDHLFVGYDSAAKVPLTSEERQYFGLAVAYAAGVCSTWNAEHNSRYAVPQAEIGEEALAGQ